MPGHPVTFSQVQTFDRKGTIPMSDLDTLTLPLLPLTTGVVLPGMVVTLTLESPEARAAVDAAASDDDRLLVLVPRLEGRYARVGTIAKIEDLGRIRGGTEALVIRGLGRASIGVGVAGTGEATWVQLEPVAEEPASERAETLAREYRATIESIVEARGVPAVAEFLRGRTDRGYRRVFTGSLVRAEGGGPRDDRRRAQARAGPRVGEGHPRRGTGEGE